MGKIVILFVAICLVGSLICSASAHGHIHSVVPSKTVSYEVEVDSQHVELYTAFANGVFDFFAKLVRAKVEVLLWLKRHIITLLIRGFASLRHVMTHNAEYVNGIIHTVAELLKILLTNKPHFAVPHLHKIMTEVEHEYVAHTQY